MTNMGNIVKHSSLMPHLFRLNNKSGMWNYAGKLDFV